MNVEIGPAVDLALRKHVERAVRPVAATEKRKLQMREELLAHVTAIFCEEQQRLVDEAAALAATCERFGNPAELMAELNRSAGTWQRFGAAVEHWERQLDKSFAKEKGQPLSRFAMRSLLTMLVLMIGVIITVCGPIWLIGGPPDSGTLFLLPRFLPLVIVSQWSIILVTAYVDNFTAKGSRRWAVFFLLSVVWSLILTALEAGFWWSISQRGLSAGEVAMMGAKTWAFIAVLLAVIAFAVDYSRALRRQREAWTLLEIEE
jgi:hypothetical protein